MAPSSWAEALSDTDVRDELLRALTAHLSGQPLHLPEVRERRALLLALRSALPELLTAILLGGSSLDETMLGVVSDSVDCFPSLVLGGSRRSAADERAVVCLLELMGAGDAIDAPGEPGAAAQPAHWEDYGLFLADHAALAVPGLAYTVRSDQAGLVRAAALEAARFRPRTAIRILRWTPFCDRDAGAADVPYELMVYLARMWPDDVDVAFSRAVLSAVDLGRA